MTCPDERCHLHFFWYSTFASSTVSNTSAFSISSLSLLRISSGLWRHLLNANAPFPRFRTRVHKRWDRTRFRGQGHFQSIFSMTRDTRVPRRVASRLNLGVRLWINSHSPFTSSMPRF